jgi:DNA-binding NtrC family response regulator
MVCAAEIEPAGDQEIRINMTDHLFALLVHEKSETFEQLRRVLWELSVETFSVRTCKDAQDLITQCKPCVIFTENALSDGSWLSLLNTAEAAEVPVSLIVVGKGTVPDTHAYVSVLDRGAFDYITPPFDHGPLSFLVRSADLDTRRRREATARAEVA